MEGCGLHQPEDSQPSVLGGLIMSPNPELFVVIGDVHAKVALAQSQRTHGRRAIWDPVSVEESVFRGTRVARDSGAVPIWKN